MSEELASELENLLVNELTLVEEIKLLADFLDSVPEFSILPSTSVAQ